MSSVNPHYEESVSQALREAFPEASFQKLESIHAQPFVKSFYANEQLGLDRLLNLIAVKASSYEGKMLQLVDAGTAVKVDAINADGTFVGGALLPGLEVYCGALANKLPHLKESLLGSNGLKQETPVALGCSTQQAAEAGIYYGFSGSVVGIIKAQQEALLTRYSKAPDVLVLTGGNGLDLLPHLKKQLSIPVIYEPDWLFEGMLWLLKQL